MLRAIYRYTVTLVYMASYVRSLRLNGVMFNALSQTIYAHLCRSSWPKNKSVFPRGHTEYWDCWFPYSLLEIVPAIQVEPSRATLQVDPVLFDFNTRLSRLVHGTKGILHCVSSVVEDNSFRQQYPGAHRENGALPKYREFLIRGRWLI